MGLNSGTASLSQNPIPNDPGDADNGGNRRQNYPVLDSAQLTGGNMVVEGSLNSTANSTFTLEFFSNAACDASGYGEGETPLGTINVSTDASGIVGFNATLPTVPANRFITATATDAEGNTSEFSACRQVVENPFSISGRVADAANVPMANVKVNLTGSRVLSTVTDSGGNYRFADLPDGIYTVTPLSELYNFAPASRTYTNPSGDQTNQNFTGARSRYRVTGVVRTDCNGALQALRQVNLTVSGAANQSSPTDASGRAVLNLAPSGDYVLTPSFGNYSFTPASVNLPNPLTGDLTIEFVAQSPVPLCTRFAASEGSGGVRSMNADGSGFAELYAAGTYATEPDLSRDGRLLTFVENNQIFVANFDGTARVQLTSGDSAKHFPRISPDKTKIVYQQTAAGSSQGARLYLINLADLSVSVINTSATANNSDLEPSWSPDGAKIVFRRIQKLNNAVADNIFSVKPDGTSLTQLTSSTSRETSGEYSYPDWSPDGTKIVFAKKSGTTKSIMLMNAADGGNLAAIHTPGSVINLSHPRWSPDGSKIAFIEKHFIPPSSAYGRLVVINPDGTGRIEIQNGQFGGLSWALQNSAATSPGTNISVQAGGVSLNFGGVNGGGQTVVSPISPYSAGSVPGGFILGGIAYEITTTASYSAPITVCFTIPPAIAPTGAQFNALSLMHNETGVLVDRTTSRNFQTRQICGTVNSLSPFALAEQMDPAKPQISGLVLDSHGNPLSGVRMRLTGAEIREAETETDGSFKFVNLTDGANYNVQPKQLGYIFDSYSEDFINLSGEQTVLFTGTPGGYSIGGRVSDSNGSGVSNVLLRLEGAFAFETMTDADGNYTFENLPADGAFVVRPFDGSNAFAPSEALIEPLLSNVSGIDFTQLAPTAASVSVSGRIVTAGGLGVRGARVRLTEADGAVHTAQTNTFGYFCFDRLAAGQTVIVEVFAERYRVADPTRILNVTENVAEVLFIAEE